MRNFRIYGLCAVAATALLMAGCGGGSNTRPAASGSSSSGTSTSTEVETPAVVEAATGAIAGIPQTTGLAAAGATEAPVEIPAGESMTRGGVMFSCAAGETACMVSFTADAMTGDVSGTWSGGEVTAMFVNPLENMNPASAASVAAIMNIAFDAVAVEANPSAVPPVVAVASGASLRAAVLGGLKNGGMIDGSPAADGIGADDISKVSVTDALDPNGPAFVVADDDTASPGSTVTAAEDTDGNTDDIGMEMAGAVGLAGWNHRVLHSDWGDTRTPDRDGGFETLAVVYSNMAAPGPVAFEDVEDAFAMDMITFGDATVDPKPWFLLNAGVVEGINTNAPTWAVPTGTITITVEDSLVADVTQVKTPGEQVKGTYFGATGTFTCALAGANAGCTIRRAETGGADFTVPDLTDDADGYNAGTWTFKPDPNQTVMLPDQDWLAFGFWLTAPDDAANGLHKLGVFYDGMDTYGYEAAKDLHRPRALNGTATYEGSAVGYYVNGEDESGLFTASSHLSADFSSQHVVGSD